MPMAFPLDDDVGAHVLNSFLNTAEHALVDTEGATKRSVCAGDGVAARDGSQSEGVLLRCAGSESRTSSRALLSGGGLQCRSDGR